MNLFTLSDVAMDFGDRNLFSNVSFAIEDTDKIGLIGANGTGKTTLFKIMLGEVEPTAGEVHRSRQASVGYLAQHTNLTSDKTVFDEALTAYEDVLQMERELKEIEVQLEAESADVTQLTQKQQRLLEAYAARDGLTYKSRTRAALLGLGFKEDELNAPFSVLSGGQKTRVALCRLLLSGAALLLLDEPTNHLDLAAVEWLEGFLRDYKGAFCLISHDRYFLDRVTNRTFSLSFGRVAVYEGNYTRSMALRAEDEKAAERRYENTMREIKRLEGIVAQQRQWNRERNIKTAESKLKAIARLEKTLETPQQEQAQLRFSLSARSGGGQDVLSVRNVSMCFDSKQLFHNLNLEVKKGNRMFLLGPNGCGKTTLFRLIAGHLKQTEGEIKLGANIKTGWYDQTQSDLHPEKTIFQEVADAYPDMTQTEIRNSLAAFLFRGDSVFSPISELSGGERARVSLVKLMLSDSNFLLLDEPTNHLDIASRQALEGALEDYDGTCLIVSHDRYFINRLAHSVCYMEQDGLQVYQGDYDYFLSKRQEIVPDKKKEEAPSQGKADYMQKKQEAARLRKLASDLKKTEDAIAACEARQTEIAEELSNEAVCADYEQAQKLTEEAAQLDERLLNLYDEWEKLSEELEKG
ncbi:MAG: ABC-F family ATP-binding cassette domain-containing protein [Ruminococcaceae bacterium]|nr:ABC-F family ATP-binding cassette domain-containing protein [Oscillospiraceae bacterium]